MFGIPAEALGLTALIGFAIDLIVAVAVGRWLVGKRRHAVNAFRLIREPK